MHIVILGAGVAGSVLSDLLEKKGYQTTIIEKSNTPGGMCKSYYKDGFVYEYGPHILANHHSTERAKKYLLDRIDVVKTQLVTASFVKNKITYYPPSIYSAKRIGLLENVKKEISLLPKIPNDKNFETYLIDKVGKTLYLNFFKNFTEKFWNIKAHKLSSDWAKVRKLGESIYEKKMFFNKKWCFYPKKDWNELFKNILRNKNILYDLDIKRIDLKKNILITRDKNEKIKYDFLISTTNIDDLHDFKFGKLKYAGYRIKTKIIDLNSQSKIDKSPVSMMYYPEKKYSHCRITNYGSFQQKKDYPYNNKTILTIETPDNSIRLYPQLDQKNIFLFDRYLKESAKYKNLVTFGRLGLFKYLTSDTTIEMAFRLLKFIKDWQNMSAQKRYDSYKEIRGGWEN